jgi:hypothetical protein
MFWPWRFFLERIQFHTKMSFFGGVASNVATGLATSAAEAEAKKVLGNAKIYGQENPSTVSSDSAIGNLFLNAGRGIDNLANGAATTFGGQVSQLFQSPGGVGTPGVTVPHPATGEPIVAYPQPVYPSAPGQGYIPALY